MLRKLLIGFFFVHGVIHLGVWGLPHGKDSTVWFDPAQSWLFGEWRAMALYLAFASFGFLVAAGIGLLTRGDWWRPPAMLGLGASFTLMVLFFSPWFAFIQLVNAALFLGMALWHWPAERTVRA